MINSSVEDTDNDDFIPTTQKRFSQVNLQQEPSTTTKRKSVSATPIEKKRTKKTNLFQDVVSTTSISSKENRNLPPPPWLDLPTG